MYKNSFVSVLTVNGKSLMTETNGEVVIPTNSEYSILLKNNHTSKHAFVEINIDGKQIFSDYQIILAPGDKKAIDSPPKTLLGNENPRKFKVIEKTKDIQNYREDDIEDGLVKIIVTYGEKRKSKFFDQPCYPGKGFIDGPFDHPPIFKHTDIYCSNSDSSLDRATATFSNSLTSESLNKSAITVEGSENKSADYDINMISKNDFTMEDTRTSFIFMIKTVDELTDIEKESKGIFVKDKKKCSSCGRKFKNKYNYCPYDATYLRVQKQV